MGNTEHLLVARRGMGESSRHVVMVGARVDDPESVANRLSSVGEAEVTEALRDAAFEVRIAFSSKQKLIALGSDWQYAFLREVVQDTYNPRRGRNRRYPLVAYLPADLSVESAWLDAYLTSATYGRVRIRTVTASPDSRSLALPDLVARAFHDAIEDHAGHPSGARDRYDALAPLVTHIEDVGFNISYSHGGTVSDALFRPSGPT
jgi:hypothetical protein